MTTTPATPPADLDAGRFPSAGTPADEVLDRMAALRVDDNDWRAGRTFSLVYTAGPEVHDLLEKAHTMYLAENALNTSVFPSLKRMQADVTGAVSDLFHGGDAAGGFMTSGGTESILMAVKAAREWGLAERGITEPEVVLATSAHAAFAKASHYFRVKSIRTEVGGDYTVDVAAMAEAITRNTVLVVGSAPQYPQGVVDDIPAIAALAEEHDILCHVDACMGGFLLPFLERLGRFDKPWDFRVPGVTSISADLHKYGYAAKGASTITYRTKALRAHQTFLFDGWLGGTYGSPTMAGTKPAGPIAAAWAVLHHLGVDGYVRLVASAHDAARILVEGVRSTEGLTLRGEPETTLVAFGAAEGSGIDIFAVSDELAARGWYADRQTPPDSLHCTVNAVHRAVVEEFVADIQAAVAEVGGAATADRSTTYGTLD